MVNFRVEKDTIGTINVPSHRLWGAQTQRSLKYFSISCEKLSFDVIKAIAQIKKIAAKVNCDLNVLDKKLSDAIICAADEVISGKHNEEFPLSVWQTGSGTQTNMNINEVLANRASELLGGRRGDYTLVHPNDHVNKSQSSNDVFPTAMHISAVVAIKEKLLPQVLMLYKILVEKSVLFNEIVKIGRTHLQDATPLTLGQEISEWSSALQYNISNIERSVLRLYELALGGTAVGTGINTHPEYAIKVAKELSLLIGYPFVTAPNKFEALATCGALVENHSALKHLSISINKIANDIRWLSSGPRCGIGELKIPINEPGSSIMPGKTNPTQCEAIMMICSQVIGNDITITIGGASGNFQLNVQRPLLIYNFLQSVCILSDGIKCFNDYCVLGLEPNLDRISKLLHDSLMLVTALNVHIGYDKSAEIAQLAHKENITLKSAALKLGYLTKEEFDDWVCPGKMVNVLKE